MVADTLEELHSMADRIGLLRSWYQDRTLPHYDICKSKRTLALSLGAIEIDYKEVARRIREYQKEKQKREEWEGL